MAKFEDHPTAKWWREQAVMIRNLTVQVEAGHTGQADLSIVADSGTWLGFIVKEQNLVWALLRRKIRLKGGLKWLQAFDKCFPA